MRPGVLEHVGGAWRQAWRPAHQSRAACRSGEHCAGERSAGGAPRGQPIRVGHVRIVRGLSVRHGEYLLSDALAPLRARFRTGSPPARSQHRCAGIVVTHAAQVEQEASPRDAAPYLERGCHLGPTTACSLGVSGREVYQLGRRSGVTAAPSQRSRVVGRVWRKPSPDAGRRAPS